MPTKISAFRDSKGVNLDEGDEKNTKSSSRQHIEGSQTFLLFLYFLVIPSASYCYFRKI